MNRHVIYSVQALLQQLQQVLSQLTEEQYNAVIPVLSGASIGQHTRHIIEFFQALEEGYKCARVNYDTRKRDYVLETSLNAARHALDNIIDSVDKTDTPLCLDMSMDNGTVTVGTHYSRELIYNLEHTVHHMALLKIGIMAIAGIALPESFGVAASTIQYRKQTACVQ